MPQTSELEGTYTDGLPTPAEQWVFIDPSLPDVEFLLYCCLRPGLQAMVLDSHAAPAQIAAALRDRPPAEAIHILAHGQPGTIEFAAGSLSNATLADHAADLAEIGGALAAGGGLHLWSCNTAQGPSGAAFVDSLARIAGVPVSAATGLVGAAWLGGRWELDSYGSSRPAEAPLTAKGINDYAAVMGAGGLAHAGGNADGDVLVVDHVRDRP